MNDKKHGASIQIALTLEQQRQLEEQTGGRVTATRLTLVELEPRLAPGSLLN
jgi:hypothetical protein